MRRAIALALIFLGCGASTSNAVAPNGAKTSPSASADDDDDDVPPPAKSAVAAAPPEPPITAADGSLVLQNLFGTSVSAADFPKPSTTDADCVKGIGYTGTSSKDYVELINHCGAPTGLKEFVKTVTGKLDPEHPRQVYTFKMLGGFCYRFFAVADDTIHKLSIRVQRPEGALVSIASNPMFVTVMNPDSTWCKNKDREFRLVVESGTGKGTFQFGIWARKKPS